MKKKKLLFLLLVFALLFILSACGAESKDTMSINSEFKGKREISLNFGKENNMYIKGGLQGLGHFLRENVQAPLSVTILTETDEKLEAIIDLPFSNLDDYKAKVSSLVKQSDGYRTPLTEFTSSKEDIFIRGVKFFDDVTSIDLLNHLIDQAIEQGLIRPDLRDKIIKSNTYNLYINNKIELKDQELPPYKLDNFQYMGPSQYIISTSPQDRNSWTRAFSMVFPKEHIDKLGMDWQRKIIQNPKIQESQPIEIKDGQGRDSLLFKYTLEKQSPDAIELATKNFFQTDTQLSFSINPDPNTFKIDYIIDEKVALNKLPNQVHVSSIYYNNPKDTKEHYPNVENVFSSLDEIEDALMAKKEELVSGYNQKIQIKPSFPEAQINTEIQIDGSMKRSIILIKGNGFYDKYASQLITNYLASQKLQASDYDKKISFKYGPEKFSEINELFFDANPKVDMTKSGLFTYNINYSDQASFNKFEVKDLKQNFVGPKFSNIKQEETSFTNNKLNNSIQVKGPKFTNISIALIVLIILLVGAFYIYRLIRKQKKVEDGDFEKTSDLNQTQPIPTVDESVEIIQDKKIIIEEDHDA